MTATAPLPIVRPLPATAAPQLSKLKRSPWFRGEAIVATVTGAIAVGLLVVAVVVL